MLYTFNIPSIIQALAQFVQVLDQYRFGAVMLVIILFAAAVIMGRRASRAVTAVPGTESHTGTLLR